MFKYLFTIGFILSFSIIIAQPRFSNLTLPTRCAGTNQTDTLRGLTAGNNYVVYLMPGSIDSLVFNNVPVTSQPFIFSLPSNLNQGSYFFQLTKKGQRNTVYDTSDVFRVDERIGITPTITASPTAICSGQSIAFTLSHNSPPYSYTLDFGDGSAVRTNPGLSENKTYTLSTFGSGSTSYRAIYTVSNGTCPSKIDTEIVTVKEKPFSQLTRITNGSWRTSFNGDTTFTLCNQSSISQLWLINFGDLGNINNYSIQWGDGNTTAGSSFPSPQASYTYTSLGSKNITYTITGTNGCSNTLQYGIYIGSNPAVTLGNPGNTLGGCIPQFYSFPISGINPNTGAVNTPGTRYTIFSSDSMGINYTFNHPPPAFWNKNFAQSSCGFGPTPTGVNNSFYVQINAFNACGSSQALISPIQIDEKPRAGFTILDPFICQNTSVSFQDRSTKGRSVNSSTNTCDSASTIHYAIYRGNVPGTYVGMIPVGTVGGVSSFLISLPGNYYAIQIVENATGSCPSSTDTQYFCVQSRLFPRFSSNASPTTSCANVRYTLTNITDTSQTCNQKQWRWSVWDSLGTTQITSGTSGVTINNPTNTNGDIQFTNPGKYIIRLSATNDCGTFDTSMLISVKRKPTLTISPNIAYCGNQTISFQSANHTLTADQGFGTISQYSWSSDSLSFSSATTTNISNSIALRAFNKCPKTYQLTVRATNECGISDPVTQNVTIHPPLTPDDLSNFQMVCQNAPANLITGTNHLYNTCRNLTYIWETSSSGTGPWTTAPGTSNGVNYAPGTMNTAGTFFYQRRVSDGVCSSSDTMSIVVKPSLANNSISANQEICFGFTPSPLTGSTPTGGNGVYTYQWQLSTNSGTTWNNVPSAGTSSNYSPGVLTVTTWYRRIVEGVPCIGDTFRLLSNTVIITVNPKPRGVITFNPNATCSNLPFTATLTPTTPPAVNIYQWSSIGTPAISIQSPGSASTLITPANNQSATSYNYTLICSLTSDKGCIDTVQKPFIIGPRPTAGFSIPSSACSPLTLPVTNSATGGTIYFYTVTSSVTGYTATIDSSLSKSNPKIILPVNNSGSNIVYTIVQKVFNATGCFDTTSRTILIFPRPNARISSVDSICAAGVVNISFNGVTPPAISTYNWSITANTTPAATIAAPSSASTFITFPDQQNGSNQTITLRQIVTTSDGCGDTTTKTIIMLPRPLANLTRSDSAICAPGSVTLANANPITGASYSWSYASTPAGSTNNQNIANPTSASTLVNFGDRKGTRDTLYTFNHIINDSRGCKDTATINVNVHPRPTAAFAPVTGIDCTPKLVAFTNSSSGQLGASPYRWTINTTTYTSATPSHTFTNTGVIDSTYLTKLVVTSGFGCKDSTSGNYTIHPNPKARFSASSTSACAPFRIDSLNIFDSLYTGTNGVYSWYVNGTLVGSSATSTGFPGYTITNTGDSVTIRLIVSSKFGCTKNDTTQMVFRTITNPVPNFTMSTNAGCEPLIITLTSTTNPPGVTHLWQVGNQATITSGSSTSNTSLTIQVNNPGTSNWIDSVRLKVTAGTGCTDSVKQAYTVYPKPNAGIQSVDSICAAGVVNISFNGSTPPAINTYNWSIISNITPPAAVIGPNSASTSITFPDQQGGSNQAINLRQIVTTSLGCADTATKTIIMLPRPLANLTRSDSAICAPGSVTLANANPITGASYSWSYASTPAGSTNNQNIANPTSASTLVNFGDRKGTRDTLYTFNHIINDSRGCKDTATINVNVHPRPTAAFTPLTGTACTPSTVSFNSTSTGQVNASSYSWNINNRAYTSVSPSHTFTNIGVIDSTYLTKLVVTSGFGCKDSTTGNYTIYPNPKARFSASSTSACAPFRIDSLNIFDSLYTGTNGVYSWYVNGVLVGSPSATLTGFPGYTMTNGNDSVIVKLVVSSKFSCPAKDSMQMVFRTITNPVPNFTMSTNAGCEPLIITLTSTSTPPGVAHLWQVGNQATITSGTNTSNTTLTIQVNNPGTTNWIDSVQLKVAAGTGCSDSIRKAYTIYPKPVAGIQSVDSICAFGVVNIGHNGSTPPAINAYNWSIISNITPPAAVIGPNSASTSITFPDQQGGSNQAINLRQIVTTSLGCADTATKTIIMLPRPLANLTRSDSAICAPGSVTLANTNPIAGASYSWSYASTPAGSTNNQNIANPSAASTFVHFGTRRGNTDTLYTFTHMINDSRGCKDTAAIQVNVHPKPTASYSPLNGIDCAPKTVSFTNSSTGQLNASSYSWNINNRAYTSVSPSHNFTNTGVTDSTYNTRLIATSGFGCKDTLTGTYTIHPNPKARFSAINVTNSPPFQIDSLNIIDSLYTGANGVYTWYVNGSIVGTPSASSTGFPGYTIFNGNDSAIVKLVVSSRFGCSFKDSMQMVFRTSQNTGGVVSPLSYLKFNYQGSLYTSNGQFYSNKGIRLKFTITDSTATNYIETQSITTDFRGHFATKVGDGTSLLGSLADIPWWDGKGRYLTTQIDTNSTGNWISMGQSELISVPYAFYAMRSGDGSRTLFGSFDTNGNTLSGRGFTVRFIGGNRYEINFLQPFSEMPYINVKLIGNGIYSDKIISKTNQRTTIEITGNPDQIQFEAMGR